MGLHNCLLQKESWCRKVYEEVKKVNVANLSCHITILLGAKLVVVAAAVTVTSSDYRGHLHPTAYLIAHESG